MKHDKCPDCGGEDFFIHKEKGEVICKHCSFVLDDSAIDFGRESFTDLESGEGNTGRTGAAFDPRVANNLMTEVGSRKDLAGLPKSARNLMKRIRKKNRWVSSSLEHNLNDSLSNLKIMSSNLKVPEYVEKEAARIYREAAERGITMARPAENILAASLYVACRVQGLPKTMNEVVKATKVSKKVLGKTYKLLTRRLNIKIVPHNPSEFITKIGSLVNLSAKVQTQANKMIEKFTKLGLCSGKSPVSLAATALYLSALLNKEKVTQQKIAEKSGITETTLRHRCKEMIRELKMGRRFKGKIAF